MRAIKRWEDPKWSKCSGVPSRMMVNPLIVRPYRASLKGIKVRMGPDCQASRNGSWHLVLSRAGSRSQLKVR
jgi:hypothetical protein